MFKGGKPAHGDLWMATLGGSVWRYDGERVMQYPVRDGSNVVTLFSISKDRHDDLWLGTHEHGVYKFDGDSFERFRP
jgi:ligand-binding sensor domain-containing protein